MFAFIAQKLMEGDVQFFRDKIVEERIAFYVEVRVGYDFSRSLGHSLDLGTSPRFYRVDPSQLSASQQAYLRDNKRKLDKEPPKLCSFHQQDTVLVDFVDCLLYFILNHSVIVLDVLTIVQYKCADFMYNYMQMLQDKRSKTTSDIESKMVKALGGFQLSLSTLLFFCNHCHCHCHCQGIVSVGNFIKKLLRTTTFASALQKRNSCGICNAAISGTTAIFRPLLVSSYRMRKLSKITIFVLFQASKAW